MLDIPDASEAAESLHHVCAEDTNTFVFTGDSAGCIKVWDISDLVEQSVRSQPISRAHIKILFAWRAHLRAVVRVEYLKGVEGLISASTDCTVRLWSLSGEQIGLFGQAEPWRLADHGSWLDAHPASLLRAPAVPEASPLGSPTASAVAPDDKTAVSESRLKKLLPNNGQPNDKVSASRRAKDHQAILDEQLHVRTALNQARIRSRGESNALAQKSATALQPPEWRLRSASAASLSRSPDFAGQDATRHVQRQQLMSQSKARIAAATHVAPMAHANTPPKYACGGPRGPWGAATSDRRSYMRPLQPGVTYEPLDFVGMRKAQPKRPAAA